MKSIKWTDSAKELAYVSVFTALLIAVQLLLSFVPGVELVTVLFASYSFSMGVRRGVAVATVFSLLRQLVFGFFPTVLVVYLIYFNLLCVIFGLLGRKLPLKTKHIWIVVLCACICTAMFSMIDNILTPLWHGYSKRVFKIYFYASFSFMLPQIVCTAISVFFLFYPLARIFKSLKTRL